MPDSSKSHGTPLPYTGGPAGSAMRLAGIHTLEDLTHIREKELLALHGVGPKAVRILRGALAAHGLAFAPPSN